MTAGRQPFTIVAMSVIGTTWAMILVIAGWIAGWSAIGAWRMSTRDA
jgi:hypothetical protein